jgi:Spy/CpxP family protein refolding chaperone
MQPFRTLPTILAMIPVLLMGATVFSGEIPAAGWPDPAPAQIAMGPPALAGGPPAPPRPDGPGGPGPFGPPPPGGGHEPGPWWHDAEMVRLLGLSEAQVRRIAATFFEHRLRLVDLRADLEKEELSLQPLLDAEMPDEPKVTAQIDLIAAARARVEKTHALMLLAIRRVLTPEQWTQLQTLHRPFPGPAGGPVSGRLPAGPGGPPPH